jgi:hypothetical protein
MLSSWLARTRKQQEDVYGIFTARMSDDEFAEYVRWNFLAAHAELGEAIQHLPWKPWRGREGRPNPTDAMLAGRELVDVLIFLGNLFAALGWSDDVLAHELERKRGVNREREEHERSVRV